MKKSDILLAGVTIVSLLSLLITAEAVNGATLVSGLVFGACCYVYARRAADKGSRSW